MSWLTFSPWQIALSVVTPILVAVLVCLAETRGPLAAPLQRTTGIVAPYFIGIALLFALVTAQMLTEVWQKDNASRQSVQAEDDAIRALLHLARVHGIEAAVLPPIKAYIAAATEENPSRASVPSRARRPIAPMRRCRAPWSPPLASAKRPVLPCSPPASSYGARDRRLYNADDQTAAIKWASVLVLGALTQIAIMLVHIGHRRALVQAEPDQQDVPADQQNTTDSVDIADNHTPARINRRIGRPTGAGIARQLSRPYRRGLHGPFQRWRR